MAGYYSKRQKNTLGFIPIFIVVLVLYSGL